MHRTTHPTTPPVRPWVVRAGRVPVFSALLLLGACSDGAGGEASPLDPGAELPATAQEIVDRWLDLDLNAPPNYAEPEFPVHYDDNVLARDNAPFVNRVTDAGAALGRVLFYDEELSLNRSTSCATCHLQELGFTDDEALSTGFRGERTSAHSMRLANANFYAGRDVFWDRRVGNLEEQTLLPIMDPVEMGFTEEAGGLEALVERLEALEYYPVLFEWAFGSESVTENRIAFALAQFVRSLVSYESDFDTAFEAAYRLAPRGEPIRELPDLSPAAQLGFRIFTRPVSDGGAGCASCHELPMMTLDANTANNGLDPDETRVFKTPSLKNVAVTGPYMHDGRFPTLDDVVEHYVSGVVSNPALDRRLRGGVGGSLGLDLTQAEKSALVSFMQTFTDDTFLRNPKFSDPFLN